MKNGDLAWYSLLGWRESLIFQNITVAKQCIFGKINCVFFLWMGPMNSENGPTSSSKIRKMLKMQEFFSYPNARLVWIVVFLMDWVSKGWKIYGPFTRPAKLHRKNRAYSIFFFFFGEVNVLKKKTTIQDQRKIPQESTSYTRIYKWKTPCIIDTTYLKIHTHTLLGLEYKIRYPLWSL